MAIVLKGLTLGYCTDVKTQGLFRHCMICRFLLRGKTYLSEREWVIVFWLEWHWISLMVDVLSRSELDLNFEGLKALLYLV